MKAHVYKRFRDCEHLITEQIEFAKNQKAHRLNFKERYERVMSPLVEIKAPAKVRDMISHTFTFIWKKEIMQNTLYPICWDGHLYSKWESWPEDAKEYARNNSHALPRIAVFSWHFTEGMNESELV